MHSSPLAIITMRRELAARYQTTTRQWLAARSTYRRLHDAPVKNIIALRDAAQRLDQLDRGRASLMRDLKALSAWSAHAWHLRRFLIRRARFTPATRSRSSRQPGLST